MPLYVGAKGNVIWLPVQNATPAQIAQGSSITGGAGPVAANAAAANGASGGAGSQQPGIFGTGTFNATPYPINDAAIAGNPIEPLASNYGLNQTWLQLQGAINGLAPQNYATGAAQLGTAPQTTAAQGVGAQGTAAQGSAAQSLATTGGPASYNAATGNAAVGGPSSAFAAQGYGNAFGQAAQGGPSFMGAAQGAGALGQATQGQAAQMLAAQGGYALGGPQNISTAGDQAWQAGQQGLANTLATTANGGGVSPADLQLKRDQDAQIAAQLAVLGSQRGNMGNAALATRAAADQAAQTMQATNAQYGVQRAQETLAAQQALGNVLGTARGQAQGYNLNQAQLAQQMGLANLGNAQAATMQNAGFQQQAGTINQAALQQAMLANLAAQNSQTQQNVGNLQQAGLANLGYQQAANEFNAQQAQQAMLANLGAQNQMAGLNVGNMQGLNLANLSNAQQTALFNAGQNQAMTLANMGAANQMTGLNLGAINAANASNAGMSQQSNLANLAAVNAMTGQNSAQAQQMAMANLAAQNQFGLSNLGNAQAMGLANLGNAQQSNIANQAMLGQYGLQQGQFNQQSALANQQAAINAQQQYYNMLLGLTGATTGIAQSNRAASLADQQLQVQQQIANNQVNAQAYANSAAANSNLAGAVIGAGGAVGAQIVNGLINSGGSSGGSGLPPPSSAQGGVQIGGPQTNVPSTSTIADTLQNPTGLAGVNPAAQAALSDRRQKTSIRPGRRALEAIFALSDENLKTGIEGGNPMMRSFLDQYEEFHNKQANIDPTIGESYHLTRGQGTAGGMVGGSHTGSQVGGAVGGAAGGAALGAALGSVIPVFGTAIGGLVGGAIGSQVGSGVGGAFDSSGHYVGGSGGAVNATGEIGNENISDEPDWAKLGGEYEGGATAQSDDQAKENVISGNRGMQSFLNQANAQQQAQSNQGQQNNAFMQTGQAPSTQVDRQLPPMQDVNAGYGQPQGLYGPMFGGNSNAGFQSAFGNTYGGGISQGGGIVNPGYFAPGSITQNAGFGGNFGVTGGNWTQGPIQWGGVANPGSYSLAGIDAGTGGMTDFGGVNQGATLTQPWIDFGGVTGGGGGSMPTPFATPGAFQPVNANPVPNNPIVTQQTNDANANAANNAAAAAAQAAASAQQQPTPAPPYSGPAAAVGSGTNRPAVSNNLLGGLFAPQIAAAGAGTNTAGAVNLTSSLLSDEDAKTDIKNDPAAIRSMLDQLQAHQYRYKDPTAPGAGPGTYVSPMAQELEKTDLGRNFVRTGPDGYKQVDYGHALGTMLAGQAMLHHTQTDHDQRLSEVERMLSQLRGGQ